MNGERIVNLTGPTPLDASEDGKKHKWRFRNDTGEPIWDFFISTWPRSFLEIEWPWGETGNPPDIRRVTLKTEMGDVAWSFNDEITVKIEFEPPLLSNEEFEIEVEFDKPFEIKEYILFSPTDINQFVIEGDNRAEPSEADNGTKELLESVSQLGNLQKQLNAPESDLKATLTFDKKAQKHKLSISGLPAAW